MSAFAWLRRTRRPSSPPELPSSAGRHSASRRPASLSDSSNPASAQRVLAACASGAARRLRPVLASALLALPLLAGLPTGAQAQVACSTANADGSYNVPFGWALKPSGLAAGSKFRLLFVTSTVRNATATGIATYNTFVQTRAKAGHSAISDSCGNLFKVVGSTSTVDARANTDTESTDTAALIYWLNGAKAADSYTDFYDGSWDSYAGKTESGTSSLAVEVWTGSNTDGTKHATEHFRASGNVRWGRPTSGDPINAGGRGATWTRAFYALSPIFTVGTKPVVTISAGTSPVTEGTAASFTLSVTPTPTAPLDVSVHISEGEADIIDASNEGVKTVTVPAGAASHDFTVATDNDTADERPGLARASLVPGTDYEFGLSISVTVVVTDNDATLVSLVATSDVTFTEQTPTDTAAVTVRLPRRLYAGENLAVPIAAAISSGITTHGNLNRSYTVSVSGTGATGADLTEDPFFLRFTGHDTDIVQEATVTLTPTSNDDGDTVAGSVRMQLENLASGEWTSSFTTVGGGGAPHGTDDRVRLVYADNDVMFDTLTLLDLGGPRIHLDIGTSPGVTGSGRDWTLEEGTDIVLRFSNLTRTLHSQDLVVNYAVAGAKFHVPDGHRGTRTVTIPANTRSVQVTLPTEATTADETDAKLSVMLLAATPPMGETNTLGIYTTNFKPLNFTVTDGSDGHTNRIRPIVTVETWYANPSNDPDEPDAGDPRIEGDDLQFDVRSHPAAQVPFTVWLKVEETVGTGYGDCVAAGQERVRTVRFKPGASRRTLRVPTVDDDVDEHDCEVTVSLASDASGTVPEPAQAFVNVDSGPGRGGYGIVAGSGFDLSGTAVATRLVRDNEAGPKGSSSDDGIGPVTPGAGPAVTISADATEVDEGGDVTFTVTADPAPARDLEVTVSAEQEMGKGDDRTGGGQFGMVTIWAGTTSATWTVTTISDDDALADGTVTGRIEAGDGYTVGKPFEVTVTLLDDDGVTTQSVPDSVVGVDPALVALVRGYAAETWKHPDHVKRWMRVLAAFGDDNGYTPMTAAEAQIHADKGWQRWVPVAAALAALEAAQQPLTLPAVSVSAGSDVTEGGDAVFTVTASPAPASPLSVTVTVAASGEFGVTAGTQTVPIPTTGSATLTLATSDDEADEADGSVTATVAAGDGYTVGDPASGTVAIADDDPAPATVATVDPALVAQVRGYAAETHQGQEHVDRWKRVLAAFGDDNGYTAMTAAEAQIHADKGWQRWVPVAAALAALEAAQQPLTLPAVSISAGADVTEGGDAVFTVTANPAPAAALSVTVTVAASGEFGVTAGTQTVPIPTTGSATLTLATSNDGADEPDGSVSVTVAAGDGYTVGDPASGTVAIADDDLPLPAIAVSAGDAVTEGGDATFTVTASPAPASPLSVSVTVATEGDYGIASGTRTVSIPTAGSATLTLATSDDDADEPDGSVSVTVNAGNGYTVGSPASGSVSIADDDLPPPVVSIAATAASVTEGGAAAFTLTADRAPDADLTVTLSVAETGDGDHVAAADEGPATAVIAKGATEAVFSVATVDDDVDEPDGSVTVTLKDGGGYTVPSPPGNAAAVTVSDNDAAALPSLSVADVTVTEGAWMEFTVRLSAPSAGGVSVKVSTRDSTPVSATRRDYWPISGRTVSFRAGETERSVGVIVYDDSHDEEAETFEFVLSDARGAAIGDGVAVGTITNDDPMPAAWLARFGRTVAEQALDGIAGRMSADRTPGMQGSIAGQALSFDPAANDNPGSLSGAGATPGDVATGSSAFGGTGSLALADVARAFGGQSDQSGPGGLGHDAAGFGNGTQSRTMTARDALLGSSFSLTGAADGSGGSMAFWGRAAQGSFDGREGTFSLDGTVTTGMLGADYARGKWLVGLALAQSEGEGDYRDTGIDPRPASQTCPDDAADGLCDDAVRAGDGKVEASLTAAIPYAALQASERLKLWGAAGYGTGEVTLKTALGGSYKSDTSWSMAAAGLRGDLLAPPAEGSPGSGSGAGGPALALTSDALWTRSSSEKTRDLAASESDATRLRLGLEGSYRMALEGGGHLTPKLEIGARHDGGDAETGFGVELGGGITWSDPKLGLSLDVSGRTLIAHGNDDLKDRGYAASLAFDPDPATGRGPSLSLRQEFGGQANGGLDALFQPATLEDRSGSEATSRWNMEAAYGFPAFGGRWTGSPHVGLGLATGARDYSVGWRLTPEAKANAPDVSFGLRATRRESDTQSAEHTVGFEVRARWYGIESPPGIAGVRLAEMTAAWTTRAAAEGRSASEVRAWGAALETALDRVAHDHGVVLLPARAVAAGAPDLTRRVEDALAAILADGGETP